jgi:hypothetical protein|tara:strand:- start:2114 stop:2914 length:801 start_codon:yes stop_codon:yes gene_type:complete
MQPSFGGNGVTGSVADRINQMRSRSGLDSLQPDAIDEVIYSAQKDSDAGDGPYSDAETVQYDDYIGEDQSFDPHPPIRHATQMSLGDSESNLSLDQPPGAQQTVGTMPVPGAQQPVGLMRDKLPVFATKKWYLWNFIAPLPYFAYTAYQFRNSSILASQCKGDYSSEACTADRLISQSELDYDAPAAGTPKDVFNLYRKEALWALIWSGIGGSITGYHAHKRGSSAKSVAMYGAFGASIPLAGISLSLMQGFPKYNKPGQTKRSKK